MGRVTDFLLGRRDNVPAPRPMVGFPNDGGLTFGGVTTTTSLGLSAVWRCLDVLSNGVSQLTWRELRGNLELPPSRLVSRPQGQRTRREWTSLVVSTLALYDVCYLLKAGGEDSEGVPLGLWPLDPLQVLPVAYDYASFLPPDEYYVGRTKVPASELVILHRSPQPCIPDVVGGVLNLARTTFAAAIAAERYASRYWQAGGSPTTYLRTEGRMPDTEAEKISERWTERRSRGPDYAPVLTGGMDAKSFGADPTTESAVEARRELVADVGRYFGITTRLLNAPTGDKETYTSTEAGNQDLVRFTLENYIGAIEDAVSDQLPGGRRMSMDRTALTAGTQYTRAQTWQLATGNQPWMDPEEVREIEGLPPREIVPPKPAAAPVPGGLPA
jgi:HK97 family phage portal protein